MRAAVAVLGIAALLVSAGSGRGGEVDPPRPPAPIPAPQPSVGTGDLSASGLGSEVTAFADSGALDLGLAKLYRRLSSGAPPILWQPDAASVESRRDTLTALAGPLGFTPAQRTLSAEADGHILDLPEGAALPAPPAPAPQ